MLRKLEAQAEVADLHVVRCLLDGAGAERHGLADKGVRAVEVEL